MNFNQSSNEFEDSFDLIVPIMHNFYLHIKEKHVPHYRNIPIKVNDYGKVTKSFLHQKTDTFFQIHALSWGKDILVRTLYLHHFVEILVAYVHNHLYLNQEYIILHRAYKFGIKLVINPKSKQLDIEKFDLAKNKFIFIISISKIESRIIIRMLYQYLNNGEILTSKDDFAGNTKCNYSDNPFYLKVLE